MNSTPATDLMIDPSGVVWEYRVSPRIGHFEIAKPQPSVGYRRLLLAVKSRGGASCNFDEWHYWLTPDGRTICRRRLHRSEGGENFGESF